MSVQDGKCVCDDAALKLNPNGQCALCAVDGCESCAVGDSATCVKCTDCSATIQGGVCECAVGYVMKDDGVCVGCPIVGCEDCTLHADQTATCNSCGDGKQLVDEACVCTGANTELEYGSCECIVGYRMVNGACVACQLDDCVDCMTNVTAGKDDEVCLLCNSDSILDGGVCIGCSLIGC